MAKTKEITIICDEARMTPRSHALVRVHIDAPDVEDALMSFHSDDLIKFMNNSYSPAEVFDQEVLEKWAEENGYIKSQANAY